ncbi:aconitate hydratase AcnA [Naasia sp. SYSU D00057]|uniref:aconitate hydratase AcnA n=1 Tax=Naasia sp. SYSU D00057 TaxID=2817380 RepID=UPI001B30F909|nr:aconitate hydratase AcnA [Naasia sp. SYSU D00057]
MTSAEPGVRQIQVGDRRIAVTDLTGLPVARMPYSLRPILESVVRHYGTASEQVDALLDWNSAAADGRAVDLYATRVFLHDTNGVPTLVDLAAMRHAARELERDPAKVNPQIPAELVVDHSVIVDVFGTADAYERNVDIEYERNAERYRFLKWGQQSFEGFEVVPPGTGIMHQVNIEYLARIVEDHGDLAYPDVCLGTDSHTTMVDALGVLGWGIGGIEAEAVMLGEPFTMLVPPVIGFRLTGELPEGATTTDLVLTITQRLRSHGVVGTFVEFFGPALAGMSVADRATIANMCPEFGATCAYFPIDQATVDYLRFTGRPETQVQLVESYAREQGLWYDPAAEIDYADVLELDLDEIRPSVAGPRRPQDRVALDESKARFRSDLVALTGQTPDDDAPVIDLADVKVPLRNGAVAVAAITSCTNTSNPEVMIAAGLLARNAVHHGLSPQPWVKTSLSPGSRVVTDYFDAAGLTPVLDEIGFSLTGYGCMTCIGASGPLIEAVQDAVRAEGVSVAAVLSGNRNFDGRINPDVRLNYLASPPLVVAYALAGTVDIDFATQPLGHDSAGRPIYLRDIWPKSEEVAELIRSTVRPEMFAAAYEHVFEGDHRWAAIATPESSVFEWDEESTYLRRPPYLDGVTLEPRLVRDIRGARALAVLGDQITTDHLSPAGAIPPHTPAGEYLLERGVQRFQFNTYASRRGNHEVMMRGTLANVRLRNALVPEREGGYTLDLVGGSGERTIFDAAQIARRENVPLVILGGKLYGAGSSRDWAAKGPALLGVKAVIAESFERIHRSNLIGMGVLPLEYVPGESAATLGLTGHERFDIVGLAENPSAEFVEVLADGTRFRLRVRLDTDREREYYRAGGIMKYVFRRLVTA